ncbi:MAG: protoheme IX farnesyltransferase [Beggiatoa sp. IS2]|nr:MAG: protoheme IX farnesyltransferase [Beggiatoa sp. IS2]
MTESLAIYSEFTRWRAYLALCKPKVVALIIFTAIVGMLLASPGLPPLESFIWGNLGIALASASAAAINHVIDEKADAVMGRTAQRPIPTGQLSTTKALSFAIIIGIISMLILVIFVNLLTAILTLISLVGYAIVYTVYLKHLTPQNIVIGGAAGAAPPILGWTAITGQIQAEPLLLFLIIFVWTPPHFWALAIHRQQEYAKADIPMLPVTHGIDFTRLHILLYTVMLFLITLMPYLIRMNGIIYLIGAIVLGGGFLYYAIALYISDAKHLPIQTFVYSIYYLMALFAFLLIDHYLAVI